MDEKLKQLEKLLSMFDARDNMWGKHNRQIGNVIAPTVLEALYELLELDHDSVEWVDLQIMENVMLIICNVTYDPATTQSVFLQRVDDAERPDTPIQVQRFLRIGVPLAIVFATKDEIKEFLLRIPIETSDGDTIGEDEFKLDRDTDLAPPTIENPNRSSYSVLKGFDASELNADQLKSLLLYTSSMGTTKQ